MLLSSSRLVKLLVSVTLVFETSPSLFLDIVPGYLAYSLPTLLSSVPESPFSYLTLLILVNEPLPKAGRLTESLILAFMGLTLFAGPSTWSLLLTVVRMLARFFSILTLFTFELTKEKQAGLKIVFQS